MHQRHSFSFPHPRPLSHTRSDILPLCFVLAVLPPSPSPPHSLSPLRILFYTIARARALSLSPTCTHARTHPPTQVRDLLLQYIANPNSIILAVTPANSDIATSGTLQD